MSIGNLPVEIFSSLNEDFVVKLCVSIIIMKFGKADDYKFALKVLNPIIKEKESQIFEVGEKMIKDSIFRDWIGAKYVELILVKKLESEYNINVKELPFSSMSPREFERLIYWILKLDKRWRNVQWRGAAGKEKGKDIFAIKVDSNQNWIIQAKRKKNFSRKELIEEVIKVKPELEKYNAEGYLICISKNASDKLRKAAEEIEEQNNYVIMIWDNEDLNFKVKNSPLLLLEFFNIRL
ncbi:MAG: restriction endonuclease [Promethearchaeota archaeon]